MSVDVDVLKELRKISKIITISNGPTIEKELSKYATSGDRKKIWVLIDGSRQADDIVKISGLTQAPVYKFLKMLEDAGLVERQHGKPPHRLLDYVPAEWIELVQIESKQASKEEQPQTSLTQSEIQKGKQNG